MEKTTMLLDLLKTRESKDLTHDELEALSGILGKTLYVINNVYYIDYGHLEQTIQRVTPEEILQADFEHESTLYFTNDKFLPFLANPELMLDRGWYLDHLLIKVADTPLSDGKTEIPFDFDEDKAYINIKIQEADGGPKAIVMEPSMLVDVYVFVYEAEQE